MIHSFIAHTSPGRSRIFALVKGPRDELEAVTTLGADDLPLTGELVDTLNSFLAERDETSLGAVLDGVPQPVRLAVRRYLAENCTPIPGMFTGYGPVEVVRPAVYFSEVDDELEEYLESAYMIGLGIRMSNERRSEGGTGWIVQLLSDEISVPPGAELRTWPLPVDAKLMETWSSNRPTGGIGPVRSALDVAEEASDKARWVRIHTLLRRERDSEFEGSATSEFVVDIFDAPIPPEAREE
ncbi:hypothetical protein [Streptomyces sp. NPDC088923]|uniref:hypothetical protein n=1 Tax=Streptomyces sp. NPDC088923 TaxID=3365913 RepID=UPI003827CD17